jgi:hypothetical protein
MVKAVQDVEGSLADPAASKELLQHMVAEPQHQLVAVKRGDRFNAAAGGPNSPAGDGMDMRMQIETVAVALHREHDAWKTKIDASIYNAD